MLIISISNRKVFVDMLISFFRTVISYILVVFAVRIMGKRQVGQLEPTELVVTLMISDLATIPLSHVSIPLLHGVIPIVTLIMLEATLSFVELKSRKFRKIMSGTPVVIIKDGKLCEKEMEKLRFNLDDLLEMLRMQGSTDINEIMYAVLETSGNLSITAKTKPEQKETKYLGIPFMFICDGEVSYKALKLYNKNKEWLTKRLNGVEEKDVLFAGVDENGKFYMQKREEK